MSLKALAEAVLQGNTQGNKTETTGNLEAAKEQGKETVVSLETSNRLAVKIYSRILDAYLWVVHDDPEAGALRASEKVTEPIYTAGEVHKLKGIDAEALKAVHEVKKAFDSSKVLNRHAKR